jgi:CubicO group peptidase (beta-lactamase class C family)
MIRCRDVPLVAAAHGLALWSGPAFAQTKGTDATEKATAPMPVTADERVNQILAPVRSAHHLPGLIGAIVQGDRLAVIGSLGVRKIGSREPLRVTDQMHLWACTKAMTATMIGTLVDAGKRSAGFGSPGHAGRVDQPWGHHASGKEITPNRQDNAPAYGPAGTVHCSVRDWARFAAAHLQGLKVRARC